MGAQGESAPENLYGIVQRLRGKMKEENPKLNEEIRRLEAAIYRQKIVK